MALTQSKGRLAGKKPQKTAKKPAKAKPDATAKAKKPTVTETRPAPRPWRIGGDTTFTPTDEQRRMVEMGVFAGMTHAQITQSVINPRTKKPVSLQTFRTKFKVELAEGEARMIGRVRGTMASIALDKKHKGCVTAGIWLLKTRAGDREPMPEWMQKRFEAEAKTTDADGNETTLSFTLKLEDDRPPTEEDDFDYSTAPKIK